MRHLMPILAAAAFVLGAGAVHADVGDQLFKILADDGAPGDDFGRSVAISGTTAIVGAPGAANNGVLSGAAYLFDLSDPENPMQIGKLLATDGEAYDHFGRSVAISGDAAIVGAFLDGDNGNRSGSAYLFDISDPANPMQIAKLLSSDGERNDLFGFSVAISGGIAFVSSHLDQDNGGAAGAAYLFDTSSGQQVTKFLPDDGGHADLFGFSVAISDTTVIVTARGSNQDSANTPSPGAAYLFDISDPTNPTQIAKLLANDGAGGDYFGDSIASSGDTIIIGAIWDDDNGENSGSAYLFDISDPEIPVQVAKFVPTDGAAHDHFGHSIAMTGDIAIIGAWGDDDNGRYSGSAYLFDISDPTDPIQIAKFLPEDGAQLDVFANSIAIGGSPGEEFVIIGSPEDDDHGRNTGAVYVFDAGTNP